MRHLRPFAVGLTGILLSAGFTASPCLAMTTTSYQTVAPSSMEAQMELIHQHLTPDVLCAAGFTANETNSILSVAIAAIEADWDAIFSAQSTLNDLGGQRADIQQSLKSLDLDESARTALESQLGAVDAQIVSQKSALNSIRNTIKASVLSSMPANARVRFQQINANSARNVPIEYLALDLSDAQWAELRHALAVLKTNEEPSNEIVQVVAGYDAQYEVNLVRVNLDANLSAVNAAYTQAVSTLGS